MQQTLSPALKSYPVRQPGQAELAAEALRHVRDAISAADPAEERRSLSEARCAVADLARVVQCGAFNEPACDAVARIVRALEYGRSKDSPWLTVAGDLLARLAQPTEVTHR